MRIKFKNTIMEVHRVDVYDSSIIVEEYRHLYRTEEDTVEIANQLFADGYVDLTKYKLEKIRL